MRIWIASLGIVALLVACKTEPAAPAKPAEKVPCGDTFCTPPQECAEIVGMLRDAPHEFRCLVRPIEGETCPKGYTYDFIHDGAGPICTKNE